MRDHVDLIAAARRVLAANGFDPDMPAAVVAAAPETGDAGEVRDLRDLAWSSIDNEESRDLDQIEWAERIGSDGAIRVLVGIADVDAFVPRGSPIDRHAETNTASLYTGVRVFPMLPDVLANDRTSLLDHRERLAVVTEMVVRKDGSIDDAATAVYRARVRNQAKLVYERVGAWLEHAADGEQPSADIAAQLEVQAEATARLREVRIEHGALELETIEARTIAKDGKVVDLQVIRKNRARDLIEDLMIAANGATARFLEQRGRSSIRRVVRAPSRWDRIVELAHGFGTELPPTPDVHALGAFVAARRHADPDGFPEFSLTIVKLLGPGEYLLQRAQDPDYGHFGLAVDDYMHSTAPNRRYPDLVTQRLLKAAAANRPAPYTDDELLAIASHCTERENAIRKVERTMRKIAAASLLSSRIGDTFDAVVTGVKPDSGTFARLIRPPAEGRIVRNEHGLDVGDRVRVKLLATDVERGFIDFARV